MDKMREGDDLVLCNFPLFRLWGKVRGPLVKRPFGDVRSPSVDARARRWLGWFGHRAHYAGAFRQRKPLREPSKRCVDGRDVVRLPFGLYKGCMNHPPPPQAFGPAVNRFADVMAHSNQLAFKGVSRLARAAGVSPSALSRLINGKSNPSFLMVARLTTALEEALGFPIDPRDLVAENGGFAHRFCCDLARCRGCLPENALDEFGDVKQAFYGVEPGRWVASRHPKGYEADLDEGGCHAE